MVYLWHCRNNSMCTLFVLHMSSKHHFNCYRMCPLHFVQGRLSPLRPWSKIPPAAGPSPPLLSPPYPPLLCFPPSPFKGRNPWTHSPPLLFPSLPPVRRGPGVSPRGKFFKSRWLQVKFDAFLGKIWPLHRGIVLDADSLKIGMF